MNGHKRLIVGSRRIIENSNGMRLIATQQPSGGTVMRVARLSVVAIAISMLAVGCNSSKTIQVTGRMIKDGQPYIIGEKEGLRIFFAPEGKPEGSYDSYSAEYDRSDGTFKVVGKDGTGLPPGEYRISLELRMNRADVLRGEFSAKKSPLICTIDKSNNNIVIDLDQKTVRSANAQ